MNELGFGAALREELKAIWSTTSPSKDQPTEGVPEFETKFLEWFIEGVLQGADNAPFKMALRLVPDDLIDIEGLLSQLLGERGEAPFQELRQKLLGAALRVTAPSNSTNCGPSSDAAVLAELLTPKNKHRWQALWKRFGSQDESKKLQLLTNALNVLLADPDPIFSDAVLTSLALDKDHERLLGKPEVFRHALLRNRLLLQAAFPTQIAKAWRGAKLPVALLYRWIHAHPQAALCLSGGGIRSATFGLGILQGLARLNLLDKFHYLSTVSGGGYIGSWLSAWAWHERGLATVAAKLDHSLPNDPMEPENPQISHLRQFSNYLTPKLGLTSADTWTLLSTYIRNLLLNWSIFIPALAALLMLPRLCITLLHHPPPPVCAPAVAALGFISAVWSIVYAALNRPTLRLEGKAKPKCGKGGLARFLSFCLLPLYLSSLCFTSLWAWLRIWFENSETTRGLLYGWYIPNQSPAFWPFLVLGFAVHLFAFLIYQCRMRKGTWEEFCACLATGAFAGCLLWRGAALWYGAPPSAPQVEWYVTLATPYYLLAFLLSLFLFIGVVSRSTEDTDREWWARMSAWLLMVTGAWALFGSLVIQGPLAVLKIPRIIAAIGGVTGLVTLILSHSGLTAANKKEASTLPSRAAPSNVVLAVVAPVFVAFLIASISLGTTWILSRVDPHQEFHGARRISSSDIVDLPLLAAHLKAHSTPASFWIWRHLSLPLQQRLTEDQGSNDASLRANLANEFNGLIRDDTLYEPAFFDPETLSDDSKKALGQPLTGQRREQRNCLLLQDVFPTELSISRLDHLMITDQSSPTEVLSLCLLLAATSWLLSMWININKFSLHSVYRDRLIRAYLGASNPSRNPDKFSGFDPKDNIAMSLLNHRPLHLVNITLNLVAGENLAWQQRKAESFTASPLHAGSRRLGYRNIAEYARTKEFPGLTLGTAVAISGAAADPNMGYHSSPVLAMIMTLFNIRLGAWFGNPGPAGSRSYKDPAPKGAFIHLVKEMLGLTDDRQPYVYLSDGGHFENLGLYEMVLRRCHYIVVSDAGADPDCALEDLGNAIRKIRIDLGISIKLDKFSITSRSSPESKYCATGRIKYSEVDGENVPDGTLIYIKPSIGGDEPMDVYNYKEKSLTFPHESTADQWFSESQFESYRALGVHMLERMCPNKPHDPDPLGDFLRQARGYLKTPLENSQFSKRPTTPVLLVGRAAFPGASRPDI